MASLDIQQLRRQFGDVVAVDSVDLSVGSGELLSLLGPSGCGKTTALRIVAGFDQPTSGDVLVDGKSITSVPANRRNMGMVFQAYSLFPTMTARRNVEFGLRVRGVAKEARARKATEMLSLVRLEHRADQFPHQLSGGEQQRVALARALALEPQVLLLDEPLSALDAKVRVQLRQEIRAIQSRLGITTIYVTHDQEEAFSISDRVAIMSAGRIQQTGRPAEIYRSPLNLFVAEFVGTVNRLEGTVADASTVAVGPDGAKLSVPPHDWPSGEAVTVLIRPESIAVGSPQENGSPGGRPVGHIRTHMFLGAVTRVAVEADLGLLLADVPSEQALALPLDAPVTLEIGMGGIRLMRPEDLP
jgi:putative spermidine/putrescine transport system ATP-binding protein